MATVTIPTADLLAQFKHRADLEAQVAILTAKIAALESKPKETKKERKESPTKSKFSTDEERKEAYKQRALKAAASRKANKEAKTVVVAPEVPPDSEASKWLLEMKSSVVLGEESEAESDYSKHSSQQETDNDD